MNIGLLFAKYDFIEVKPLLEVNQVRPLKSDQPMDVDVIIFRLDGKAT